MSKKVSGWPLIAPRKLPEGLPAIEAEDAGKVLIVGEDGPEWTEIPEELPAIEEGDAGKILTVGLNGEPEWADIPFSGGGYEYTFTADSQGSVTSDIVGTLTHNLGYTPTHALTIRDDPSASGENRPLYCEYFGAGIYVCVSSGSNPGSNPNAFTYDNQHINISTLQPSDTQIKMNATNAYRVGCNYIAGKKYRILIW